MLKTFVLSLLLAAVASNAAAGTLIVSGDLNIVPGLSAPEPNDNDVFFANVLGGGTSVALLSSSLAGFAVTPLDTFYTGLGATTSEFAGAVTEAALTGVDLFFGVLPDDAFSAAEIAALQAFLSGGGTVFLLGDNSAGIFAPGNSFINALAAGLGSGMSIVPDNIDGGVIAASQVQADPLTVGVTTFYHISASQVSGGTVLFRGLASSGSKPYLAYENLGDAVPEPATWTLLGAGALAIAVRKRYCS
jgi:hypothetical protein